MRLAVAPACALLVACDLTFDIHEKTLVGPTPRIDSSQDAGPTAGPDSGRRPGVRPPGRPRSTSSTTSTAVAFVARRFYLGARDPETEGVDSSAWKRIGFDIDGVDTHLDRALSVSPGTCRRNVGSRSDALLDGDGGRDNNFGSQFLELAGEFVAGPGALELDMSDAANRGHPTLEVVLRDLADGPEDTEVDVGLFATVRRGVPSWAELHSFPLDGRSVEPGTVIPALRFPRAYMTNHVVVVGALHDRPPAPFIFPFTRGVQAVSLNPLSLLLTLELDPGHHAVVRSTLAMVLDTDDVARLVAPTVVAWGLDACTTDGGVALMGLLHPLADLSSTRSAFLDRTGATSCDAMSFAMDVGWEQSKIPQIDLVAATPAGPGGCNSEARP
jgi:hypothetical protein